MSQSQKQRKPDFTLMLAQRILYQLSCQGLIRMEGKTVDETQENVKKAQELVRDMILNGDK